MAKFISADKLLDCSGYRLLDFGEGRKLEQFGDLILDRPSPAAENSAKSSFKLWDTANLRFQLQAKHQGTWWIQPDLWPTDNQRLSQVFQLDDSAIGNADRLDPRWQQFKTFESLQWVCSLPFGRFNLKCTPFGHVGLFPEHFRLWQNIVDRFGPFDRDNFKVLSLFAYTGASSICFARSGASVTHVEAAKNVVQWARANSELSGQDLPIRWLCEDVGVYVKREAKRKSAYEGIILDPPTYGHGPKGQVWKIQRDLPKLLEQLAPLASPNLSFVLLTAHSTDYDTAELKRLFNRHFLGQLQARKNGKILAGANGLEICDDRHGSKTNGRILDAGVQLLWVND